LNGPIADVGETPVLLSHGIADFGHELFNFEGFEQHCSQAFLASADDRMVRIVAKAGHEDDVGFVT